MTLNQKIGTHDGVFHCDDVLACSMLKLLPQYKDAIIVRTRDKIKLNECDIVVDVGQVFDHARKRYDHHQREFNETLSSLKPELGDNFRIKLSSAGLVYTYYGKEIIQQVITKKNIYLNSLDLLVIYRQVYKHFIEEIDAIDNGVPMTSEEPRFEIQTNVSSRVAHLNPKWNSNEDINLCKLFKKAMALVTEEFLYTVNYYMSVWLPARDYVRSALDHRFEVHNSGKIVEIRNPGQNIFIEKIPWKEHVFNLEKEMKIEHVITYVLLNDRPNSWLVIAVPVTPTSFVSRKPLFESWRGVRDEALSKLAGIEGCIFCHSTGFIGGNTTREGALKMVVVSLEAET